MCVGLACCCLTVAAESTITSTGEKKAVGKKDWCFYTSQCFIHVITSNAGCHWQEPLISNLEMSEKGLVNYHRELWLTKCLGWQKEGLYTLFPPISVKCPNTTWPWPITVLLSSLSIMIWWGEVTATCTLFLIVGGSLKTSNDHVASFWNICLVGVPVVFFACSGCLFAPFVTELFLVLCSSGEKMSEMSISFQLKLQVQRGKGTGWAGASWLAC